MSEEELFSEMKVILSSVARRDALKIFNVAKDGIFISSRTIKELGLSQKRYYTRLKELINVGLIEKRDGTYHHTMLGKTCHQLGKVFMNVLSQRDRLDLLSKLENVGSLSQNERKKVAQALSIDETLGISNLLSPVKIIDDYEDLVHETVSLLEKAEGEVYFATQYIDARVIEELLKGMKRKVKFAVLGDFKGSFYDRLNLVMSILFSSPKILTLFYEWLKSNQLRTRMMDLLYTFIVVDGRYALVELPSSSENAFSLAFIFENRILCRKLIDKFNAMWDRGSDYDLGKSLVDSMQKKGYEDSASYEKVKIKSDLLKGKGEASKNYGYPRREPR